jgi:hypothetical protein
MDRAVFESVEREIDDEVRARFAGDVIKQAVLLHYGDDPEIEPGQLWVRVLLRADRPEDYEQIVSAFCRDHQAAMEEFPRYLAETLREIRLVEFTFPDNPVTSGGHGPRRHLIVGQRVPLHRQGAPEDPFKPLRRNANPPAADFDGDHGVLQPPGRAVTRYGAARQ